MVKRWDYETETITATPSSATPGSLAEQWAIPMLQALTAGVFVGAITAAVAYAFFTTDKGLAVKVGLVVGLVAAGLLYLSLLADARALLWAITETPAATRPTPPTAQPRDRLVLVNPPRPETVQRRLQERADGERQVRFASFVRACERSTARRSLLAAGFGEGELAEFVAILRRLGLAQDRGPDPRGGWELTRPAAEIVEHLDI